MGVREILPDSAKFNSGAIYEELMVTLEMARTRLAVNMAAEAKATPAKRWQYYLETADLLRRCLKELRKPAEAVSQWHSSRLRALEVLKQLPGFSIQQWCYGDTLIFCRILREAVAQINHRENLPGASNNQ